MHKYIFLLIINLAFSQDEILSSTEKMLYYNSERLSRGQAIAFELLLPTAGFIYAKDLKRGIFLGVLRAGTIWFSYVYYLSAEGLFYHTTEGEERYDYRNLYYDIRLESRAALFGAAVLALYSSYRVSKSVDNYNDDLYRSIFGKEPSSFSLNLQPTYQGANLNLAYNFK